MLPLSLLFAPSFKQQPTLPVFDSASDPPPATAESHQPWSAPSQQDLLKLHLLHWSVHSHRDLHHVRGDAVCMYVVRLSVCGCACVCMWVRLFTVSSYNTARLPVMQTFSKCIMLALAKWEVHLNLSPNIWLEGRVQMLATFGRPCN